MNAALLLVQSLALVPEAVLAPPPIEVVDTYANTWRLEQEAEGPALQVRPAGSSAWQPAPESSPCEGCPRAGEVDGGWVFLLADHAGFVWRGRADRLERLDPHVPEAGWMPLPSSADVPEADLTYLAASPDGMALAGFASGEVVEVDIDADGRAQTRDLAHADGAVRALYSDVDGQLWIAIDGAVYRRPPEPEAWQRHWRPLARLPGGNHDLYAIESQGRAWMAGGLTSGWGLPARTHVFDELFAYDPSVDRWQVVSRMPLPRCYGGIAELDGRLWIVGGAANRRVPDDPDGPREALADVLSYDREGRSWRVEPSLTHARLEVVVAVAAGRIWAFGGSDRAHLDVVESIGPGETAWRAEEPLPHPLNQADACVLDDVVYIMNQVAFLAFDATTGEWNLDLPQLATSPQAAQVAAHRGEVWVMGGSRRRDTNIYNPVANTWRRGPDLPCDNSWGAAVDVGGTLIVAGGAHYSERHRTFLFDDRTWALREDAERR
jgi:hypothetical protein